MDHVRMDESRYVFDLEQKLGPWNSLKKFNMPQNKEIIAVNLPFENIIRHVFLHQTV